MKPGKHYKMSKSTKTMLAKLWNHPKRGEIKRSMIAAELAEAVIVKSKPKNK